MATPSTPASERWKVNHFAYFGQVYCSELLRARGRLGEAPINGRKNQAENGNFMNQERVEKSSAGNPATRNFPGGECEGDAHRLPAWLTRRTYSKI
jgi:hypothetical protein